jgi:hypothetical protein
MDQRERADDFFEALRMALDGRQAKSWQGGPGIIQSFDPVAMTCVVQPAMQVRVAAMDGSVKFANMSLLVDVPVYFPAGGGVTLTFPVTKGDECFFAIADRCIDAWWQQGGVQPQMEARMHGLSDAFAFVGVRSQPRKLENVSTTATQLRSDAGETFVELDPVTKKLVLTAPGGVFINADTTIIGQTHMTDDVTIDTKLTASDDVIADGKHLATHTHGGVQAGSGNTGTPN